MREGENDGQCEHFTCTLTCCYKGRYSKARAICKGSMSQKHSVIAVQGGPADVVVANS